MVAGQRIALIIPTLNEEEAIGPALMRVPRDIVDRIIVADGGSTDATAEVARANGAEVIAAGKGYGRACLKGAMEASDCAIVAFMDGDGADRVEQIADLIAPIADGACDFVIGSRTRGIREAGSMSWHQILAGRGAGLLMRTLYGVAYSDMCAFRALRRSTLLDLDMREMTYGWNIEMQMKAARTGLRILETPMPYGARTGGTSKVAGSVTGTLRAGSKILSTMVRVASERRVMPLVHTEGGS